MVQRWKCSSFLLVDMSEQCEARCFLAAVSPFAERRRVEPQHLPLTSQRDPPPPKPPPNTHTHIPYSLSKTHTFPDRWESYDSVGTVWMIPSTPQRPSLSICPPPHVPLALALCFPFQSLLYPSPSSSSLLTHPLSYGNLLWLLTSCLSLIQYSGFSAIQPWPITIWHFINKLVLISSCLKTNITQLGFQTQHYIKKGRK